MSVARKNCRQGDREMKAREVSIGCGVLQIVFQLATIFLALMQLRLPRYKQQLQGLILNCDMKVSSWF